MNLEQLEKKYWIAQEELQAIAAAHGVSVKHLIDDIEEYERHLQEEVASILFEQIDLLEKILFAKRAALSSAPVVSLSSYRALIS